MAELPHRFFILEELLRDMPIVKANGASGLLSRPGALKAAVTDLPQYRLEGETDSGILAALFRDLTFLASAYLLEPCHQQYLADGTYGLGEPRLPRNIAVPLTVVAEKIRARPFLEYAHSYALYNYRRVDPQRGMEFRNLNLIRSFAGSPSEAAFILVHVCMVAHTPGLVSATLDILDAAERGYRAAFQKGMLELIDVMNAINQEMETMWRRSSDSEYQNFRTFIMGIKAQPMFPRGVVYEGVSERPFRYRGESGANDSIIPTCDNLLQLYERMPDNPLTRILRDFRKYRPVEHSRFLAKVHSRAGKAGVARFAMEDSSSALLYLRAVDQVRQFRTRHWSFTKEYIIKHSKHPVATGGSPIVTWLPNQLLAVLDVMIDSATNAIPKSTADKSKFFSEILSSCQRQRRNLEMEVKSMLN